MIQYDVCCYHHFYPYYSYNHYLYYSYPFVLLCCIMIMILILMRCFIIIIIIISIIMIINIMITIMNWYQYYSRILIVILVIHRCLWSPLSASACLKAGAQPDGPRIQRGSLVLFLAEAQMARQKPTWQGRKVVNKVERLGRTQEKTINTRLERSIDM